MTDEVLDQIYMKKRSERVPVPEHIEMMTTQPFLMASRIQPPVAWHSEVHEVPHTLNTSGNKRKQKDSNQIMENDCSWSSLISLESFTNAIDASLNENMDENEKRKERKRN